MTTSFEQRVTAACDRFLAARDRFLVEILAAARDASIEAVERSFALAMARRSRLVRAPHNDEPHHDEPATAEVAPAVPDPAIAPVTEPALLPLAVPPELAPAPLVPDTIASSSNADRVLACIRQAPGAHVGQLSQTLAMSPATVRRHVRELVAREAIRIQGAPGPGCGPPRRTFFPCDGRAGVEMPASALEASA